jgi:hypothetical protein
MGDINIMSLFPITAPPGTIPGLVGWFAADYTNNVNKQQPANDTGVASWANLSQNKNEPGQGVAANQPTFKTSVTNGLPGVLFNSGAGVNGDFVTLGPSAAIGRLGLTGATDFTIFVCAQVASLTPGSGFSGTILYNQASGVTTNSQYEITQGADGALSVTACEGVGGNSRTANMGFPVANTPFIISAYSDTTGAARFYGKLNTGSFVTSDGSYPSIVTTGPNFSIGRQKSGFPTRVFDGHVFEILIFGKQLNSTERLFIERYLGNKWGITTS